MKYLFLSSLIISLISCQKELSEPILNNIPDKEVFFIFEVDEEEDFNHPIKVAEPEFVGGNKKLYNYINAKLENFGIKSNEIRDIEVEFEVPINGKIKDVKVLKAAEKSKLLKERLTSIFQNMQKWKPGIYKNKIVGYKLNYTHQSGGIFLTPLK